MVEIGEPERFANTYSPSGDVGGWERAMQYREAMDVAAEHPQLGSSAIASRVDQPRGRVRPWVRDDDPAIPDVERGLQTAERRGWVRVPAASPEGHAFLSLV